MLHALRIENYAIIQSVDIRFDQSLNIITGETGAGKSILLGALGLIMGKRADTSVLYDKANKCFVEASFNNYPEEINTVLRAFDYDVEDELIIRREISSSGKSRAFVNDTPAKLELLKNLCEHLVDLNAQFELNSIREEKFQLSLIDAYANHNDLLSAYQSLYTEWKKISSELKALINDESQQLKEMDFLRFQFDELDKADLENEEQESLESEMAVLEKSEELEGLMQETRFILSESDTPVRELLRQLLYKWEGFSGIDGEISKANEVFNQIDGLIESLMDSTDSIYNRLEADPRRLAELEERLNTIYTLQRKHQVSSVEELLGIYSDLQNRIEGFDSNQHRIKELTQKSQVLEKQLLERSLMLRESRKSVFPSIQEEINKKLDLLAMPSAEIKIELGEREHFTNTGKDDVQILFKANRGGEFLPIKKVASGGETARLMLSLKSMVAHVLEMPTMIFDEIDSGVSGEVANRMGDILKNLSSAHQIICITHSPQVAARAVKHFFVFKEDIDSRTVTHVKALEGAERLNEIAKMLSGDPPSAFALENAKELIG